MFISLERCQSAIWPGTCPIQGDILKEPRVPVWPSFLGWLIICSLLTRALSLPFLTGSSKAGTFFQFLSTARALHTLAKTRSSEVSCVLSSTSLRKSPGLLSRKLTSAPVNDHIYCYTFSQDLQDVSLEGLAVTMLQVSLNPRSFTKGPRRFTEFMKSKCSSTLKPKGLNTPRVWMLLWIK